MEAMLPLRTELVRVDFYLICDGIHSGETHLAIPRGLNDPDALDIPARLLYPAFGD